MEIINFEKEKMIPLKNKQQQSCQKAIICHICKKSSTTNKLMIKTITKLKTIVIILVNTEKLNIAYVV